MQPNLPASVWDDAAMTDNARPQYCVFIDVETTGFPPDGGRGRLPAPDEVSMWPYVTEVALVVTDRAGHEIASYTSIVQLLENVTVSPRITQLTGLSHARCVVEGRPHAEVFGTVASLIRAHAPLVIAAHNIDFDLPFLVVELQRAGYGQEVLAGCVPWCLMKSMIEHCAIPRPGYPGKHKFPKLGEVYAYAYNEGLLGQGAPAEMPAETAHSAYADTLYTAMLAIILDQRGIVNIPWITPS